MRTARLVPSLALFLLSLVSTAGAVGPGQPVDDERTLREAGLATDGPSLLAYFRRRTLPDGLGEQLQPLLARLGDPVFAVREKATADVVALGPAALPFLQPRALPGQPDLEVTRRLERCQELLVKQVVAAHVRNWSDSSFAVRERASAEFVALGLAALPVLRQYRTDADPEIASRAARCLQLIQAGRSTQVTAAAARLVAVKQPPGGAGTLLGYLPFAETAGVASEIENALATLAYSTGTADPGLRAGLSDKLSLRRQAAVAALAQAGKGDQRKPLLPLLRDPDVMVRRSAALALAEAGEPAAVPVLVDLLGELSALQSWPVEDLLYRLADTTAPPVLNGDDDETRQKRHDVWAAWRRVNGDTVDLARLSTPPRWLGYSLVLLFEEDQPARVLDLDDKGKVRWQFEGLETPLDIQLLPDDRVLVAEHKANRVTERDRSGAVLWEKRVDGPLTAQRLANGNTFIATKTNFLEVGRDGREVTSLSLQDDEPIMRAKKLRSGDIACITTMAYVRLDPTGKELQRFPVDVRTSGGRIEVLPNGHVLVPELANNKVIEYSGDGKPLKELAAEQPIAAVRLTNGHTLVTSMTQKRAVEFDQGGKEIWEYKSEKRVTRAWRR